MKRRLMAALLATTCLTAPTPARAEPISIAILTAVSAELAASATAVAITTFALTTAATIGISMAASALLSKPEQASDTPAGGADLSVQYGAAIARSAIMGPGAVGGHHVYTNVYGAFNEALECVFVIGDGKHGKLTALKYNGRDCTLPVGGLAHGVTYAVPEFIVVVGPTGSTTSTACVGITYYDGRYDQEANAGLVANSNPPGRWTTDHRGRGQAYLYVHQIYAEGDVGLTGVPQLMIETEGLVLYDPRKDSTNGGSGAHRWGLPNTYEPSANPAVQEYNFRRGVLVNGQRVLGMSMSPVNLILQMYFAAANINDEPIPLAEGGTEPRYRCSIAVSDDRAASDVLSAMRAATAGWSFERGGQFGPIPGVPQIPISSLAFTDDDMIVGASARFTKYRSRSELVTATFGQFADPAQFWVLTAFPPRENTADDAAIGERIAKSLDLTQVYSSSQAQRIAESERRKTLQQGQGTATLPAKWIGVQPGDWLPFNSQRHGSMNVLVTGTTLDTAKQQVTLTYERTSNTVYSWTTAGELFPPDVGDTGTTGTLIMLAAGMTASGVNVPGDGGLVNPGIQFSWIPILDPTVDQIDFEIRKIGDANVLPFTADFPGAGSAVCSGHGIQASTTYEYRHKLYTNPDRDAPWSAWANVISGSQHIVPSALTSTPFDKVTLEMFEAGLKDYVGKQLKMAQDVGDRVEQLIARTSSEQEAQNWLELQTSKRADAQIVRQISAVTGGYNYRGDYDPKGLYYPNDMVRVPDGTLFYTTANVQGVTPPAAPWVLAPSAAIIYEEWRNFSGPDGVAAQTSDLIEARFKGGPVNGTNNDLVLSLARIITEWSAFAGLTYAAAQTSTSIEARFGVDGPPGTLPISVATLSQQWKAFAGPDYAAAQTSDEIKAQFFGGTGSTTLPISVADLISKWQAFAGPDYAAAQSSDEIKAQFFGATGTSSLPISVADLITQWAVFAGPDYAVSQSETSMSATIADHTSKISVNAGAIATINGELGGYWTVNLDLNGYISGLKLYSSSAPGSPPTSSFIILADHFAVAQPSAGAGGTAVPVFAIDFVNSTPKIAFRADMYADGIITARSIKAGTIDAYHLTTAHAVITDSAQIQNLLVDNIHIRGAAVTVPDFQAGGSVGLLPTVATEMVRVTLPFKGVAGSSVTVQADANVSITPNTTQSVSVSLQINGVQVGATDCPPGQTSFRSIMGATKITASGGAQSAIVTVIATQNAGTTIQGVGSASVFGCAYLR